MRKLKNRIKELYDQGKDQSEVAQALNADGIKTMLGKAWNANNVSHWGSNNGIKLRVIKTKTARSPKYDLTHSKILDVMTSNLSNDLKVEVLKAIL